MSKKENKTVISVTIDRDLLKELKIHAIRTERSVSALIRLWCKQEIERYAERYAESVEEHRSNV